MKIQYKTITIISAVIFMLCALTACGLLDLFSDIISDITPETTPAAEPEITPAPEAAPETTPNNDDNKPVETPNLVKPPKAPAGDAGGVFPFAFSAVDIYGTAVTEASFGNKELFFIHYWGTWCPPCVAEMPDLAQLERDFDDRVGFLMLLDDFDNKDGAIALYKNYDFPDSPYSFTVCGRTTFSQNHEIMRMLDIEYVPTTIIIDTDGNMLENLIGSHFDTYADYLNMHLNALSG